MILTPVLVIHVLVTVTDANYCPQGKQFVQPLPMHGQQNIVQDVTAPYPGLFVGDGRRGWTPSQKQGLFPFNNISESSDFLI